MESEPTRPTTCDHCGKHFNTSAVHPSRYCSIACEEGRAPRAISDPRSDGYHLHLQGNPEALVGKTLVANALKRTCYSPEWHKSPDDYNPRKIREHDTSEETIVYETIQVIGKVTNYENGEYTVVHDAVEGERVTQHISDSATVNQIRKDEWWVDG